MKPITQKLGIIVVMLLSYLSASAYDLMVDGIYYSYNPNTQECKVVKGDDNYFGNIIVPETINFKGKDIRVSGISDDAFKDSPNLNSVTLPNTITFYSSSVFENCSSLKSVVLGLNQTKIPKSTFKNCHNLEDLTLPTNITFIGDNAFTGCSSLTSFVLGTDAEIENNAFYNCTGLKKFIIGPDVKQFRIFCLYYTQLESLIIEDSDTPLLMIGGGVDANKVGWDGKYHSVISLKDLYIGRSIYSEANKILDGVNITFYRIPLFGLHNLKRITFGPKVKFFYNDNKYGSSYKGEIITSFMSSVSGVFRHCENLESVIFEGDDNVEMDDYAFLGCTSLKQIVLPEHQKRIPKGCFVDCNTLRDINISDDCCYIDDYAFSNCSSLDKLTLPHHLKYLGECAFEGCSSLTEVTIPATIKLVLPYTFKNCISLKNVIFEDKTDIYGGAFIGCPIDEISIYSIYPPKFILPQDDPYMENWGISENAFFDNSTFLNATIRVMNPEAYQISNIWESFFSFMPIESVTINGILYGISGNNAIVCNSVINEQDVAIPPRIQYAGTTYYVTSINSDAFRDNNKIRSLSIPNSISYVGRDALSGCSNLNNIIIEDSEEPIYIESMSLHYDKKTARAGTIYYFHGAFDDTNLTNLYMGRSIYNLEPSGLPTNEFRNEPAIYKLASLKSVELGSQCNYIGNISQIELFNQRIAINNKLVINPCSFSQCPNITTIKSHNTEPPEGMNFDGNVYTQAILYVPINSLQEYSNHTIWGKFNTIHDTSYIFAQSITFPEDMIELEVNDTKVVSPTIMPENFSCNDIVWNSSNPTIASVEKDGTVCGLSVGTSVISASLDNLQASYIVNVVQTNNINRIKFDSEGKCRYDLMGRPVDDSYHGVVIMRYADGTARKIM